MKRWFSVGLMAALISTFLTPAWAGTTGSLKGRITDSATGAPIAGVRVTANAAIGVQTVTTDNAGTFVFLSLEPDTYTVTIEKSGYETQSLPGQSIFADQSSVLNVTMIKALKTIATTRAITSGLVRAGTTSDVYSVNPAQQRAAQALGGSGSLDQAYSAIASVPGVSIPTGQQGWYQSVYIRGGDYDQVGYEFDGIPVLRQSDGAPIVTLSNLGQQEVQVYTGGTPATSDSPGLAGYINQVIKTGTYPGYGRAELGIGGPSFYHKASVEAGGATPDRRFSYYIGLAGNNATYRYGDQFNNVADPLYFYPVFVPTSNISSNVLDGTCGDATLATACAAPYGFQYAQGASWAQSMNADREAVMNFHFALPHKHDAGRDDIQMLYVVGNIFTNYTSSALDLGIPPVSYLDADPAAGGGYYTGSLWQTPNPAALSLGLFPSSPTNRAAGSLVGTNQSDGGSNAYAIEKLQYQRNINDRSYLRLIGYGEYTNWFLNGPNSSANTFGATLADYEVVGHIYGGSLIYSNDLSDKHLLTATTSYQTQRLQTYNATFDTAFGGNTGQFGSNVANFTTADKSGHCYDLNTGAYASCYDPTLVGTQANGFNLGADCVALGTCPGSPAAVNGAQWLMTENGQNAQVDNVTPFFTSFSATDSWRPNDRLNVNIGARFDHFQYSLDNLASAYPARQFWFNAYNNEHCTAPGLDNVTATIDPVSGAAACPSGYTWMGTPGYGFTNTTGLITSQNVFEPRIAATLLQNANTVWRFSAGVYARPAATSYQEYNTYQQDLPSFLSQFAALGYTSPVHNVRADTSENFDLSYERHFPGTRLSLKLTPFYRSTKNQLQYLNISALGGTLAGINVGTLESAGLELSLQEGDFERDGLSWQLSYTHTDTHTRYKSLSNGLNLIDVLNRSIEQYNSYTSSCAANESTAACGGGLYAGNGAATFVNSGTDPGGNPFSVTVANPYYNQKPQALMDPNASYVPYDVIPSAFASGNSYAVPDVASLILNWKHKKLSITPSVAYTSGSYYGSPLSMPGYVPQNCWQNPAATVVGGVPSPTTPGASCGSGQYVTTVNGAAYTASSGYVYTPDPYTGTFDSLGALKEPSQLTVNLQASYDINDRMTLTLVANNLFNKCYQRGYAWDTSKTCWYSNLPSNILPPNGPGNQPGAFLTTPPTQLAYPYGVWFNNTQVGITSERQPFQLTAQLEIKL
ncbi:MAG TPA: TonB-dependent receptor [Candidatus Aquilonibacter sp.]|nr:TonB-dependent receptor [Candidatus Aquilonibacter sp.]